MHGNRSIMEAAAENKGDTLKVLGVTVLTSLDRGDLDDLGFDCDVDALVLSRAKRALEAGCDGVISSGLEVPKLREFVDEKLLVVSPGIRPVDNKPVGDQKRVVTVETAFSNGADYIVVGRPIRDAGQPARGRRNDAGTDCRAGWRLMASSRTTCCCARCCASPYRARRSGSCARPAVTCPSTAKTRAQAGDFMSLCRNPELACEVTMQPLRRYKLDAAILFSDILTVPDAMGLGLYFETGEGPEVRTARADGRRDSRSRCPTSPRSSATCSTPCARFAANSTARCR